VSMLGLYEHEEFWMEGLGPFIGLSLVVFAVFVVIVVVRLVSKRDGGVTRSMR
jgi:hypothetical protein